MGTNYGENLIKNKLNTSILSFTDFFQINYDKLSVLDRRYIHRGICLPHGITFEMRKEFSEQLVNATLSRYNLTANLKKMSCIDKATSTSNLDYVVW